MKRTLLYLATLAGCALTPASAWADSKNPWRTKVENITNPLVQHLDKMGMAKAVVIQDPLFAPPKDVQTTGGVILSKYVREVLTANNVTVRDNGAPRLKGALEHKFRHDKINGQRTYAVVLLMSLVDDADKTIWEAGEETQDPELIAPLTGAAAGKLRPSGDERVTDMIAAIEHKQFYIDENKKSIVRATKDSKYGLEFLVADAKGPLPAEREIQDRDGMPFIPLQAGEDYSLKIYNSSDSDIGVEVRIDGRNVFEYADGNGRDMRHWCIAAGKDLIVPGWYINKNRYKRFLTEPLGLNGLLPAGISPGSLGQVTVQFHLAWDPNREGPVDDPNRGSLSASVPNQEIFTGFGKEVEQDFKIVSRRIGVSREFITVRYNTK